MSEVRYHPDGWVYLNDQQFTVAEWQSLWPEFAVPEGIKVFYYNGVRSYCVDSHDDQRAWPLPWPEGDAYIDPANIPLFESDVARVPADGVTPATLHVRIPQWPGRTVSITVVAEDGTEFPSDVVLDADGDGYLEFVSSTVGLVTGHVDNFHRLICSIEVV